ncbi:MAG: glycosyl hydrolase, partial [Rhodocyclales bacterium]|nr:glycosyl hydrolase [Rhodocyclales bacterium]
MPISLLFGVHAHQPVGNFPAVIDDAHVRSYGMFLRVMERYPAFRFSVHFSGWLLDVLFERFPDDMARLAAMTRRGQVEWFGSGDCEPVLAAIPHRDRVTQITALS